MQWLSKLGFPLLAGCLLPGCLMSWAPAPDISGDCGASLWPDSVVYDLGSQTGEIDISAAKSPNKYVASNCSDGVVLSVLSWTPPAPERYRIEARYHGRAIAMSAGTVGGRCECNWMSGDTGLVYLEVADGDTTGSSADFQNVVAEDDSEMLIIIQDADTYNDWPDDTYWVDDSEHPPVLYIGQGASTVGQ